MKELPIGGVVPFSATDYPGYLSLVLFCQGCPWRCHYCHNPHLQPYGAKGHTRSSWKGVIALLKRRQGLLDAVVFSGGEPTVHPGLLPAIKEAKGLGFRIALHTGGPLPHRFQELLPYLDWVGFDIKAPFEKYEAITKRPKSGTPALESLKLLLNARIPYELRTTVHPDLLSQEDLLTMATSLKELGATNWVLQEFRAEGCSTPSLTDGYAPSPLDVDLISRLSRQFTHFLVR